MTILETYTVPALEKPIRLSDLKAGTFTLVHSRKAFTKMIKANLIQVNNTLANTATPLYGGETICIFRDANQKQKPSIKISLSIIFEDDFLAIINKPAGIEVSGNKKYTIQNALQHTLTKSTQKDALQRPEPIHRLDYPTSGCLLIGKTSSSVMILNTYFQEKKIDKVYYAITIGKQKSHGIIEEPIDTKKSSSHFEVISSRDSKKYGALNLVSLAPKTGRKHQLRKHLASIGNPIFGDLLYGAEHKNGKGNGLYLHAYSLGFTHPIIKQPIQVQIELPKKFRRIFKNVSL